MNKNLTEIAYILDRSGSMQAMVEPAIAGFNQFLREQIDAPGSARLTLVLFDNEYLVPCDGLPIEEVVDLDTTTYVPRGSTALLDAIGRTINELGARLAAIPESARPGQVIIAIFTDGYENASRQFDLHKINDLITHQRENYNWQFLFLAANQDAIATAAQMGIGPQFSSAVQHSRAGVRSSSSSLSRKMRAMRHHASTGEKLADLDAPMEQIVKEEESKDEHQ
jgi:hypothetical protein